MSFLFLERWKHSTCQGWHCPEIPPRLSNHLIRSINTQTVDCFYRSVIAKCKASRESSTSSLAPDPGWCADKPLHLRQINRSEDNPGLFSSLYRLLQHDHLLDRTRFQCWIQNSRSAIQAAVSQSVHRQLIQHLPRQTLFPDISIFRVQHGYDLVTGENHKIRPRRGSSTSSRISGLPRSPALVPSTAFPGRSRSPPQVRCRHASRARWRAGTRRFRRAGRTAKQEAHDTLRRHATIPHACSRRRCSNACMSRRPSAITSTWTLFSITR